MKPRHKIPTPKEAGVDGVSFITKLKNSFSKNNSEHHNHNHDHTHEAVNNKEPDNVTIHTIALVIDDQVYEVLRAQDSLADLLLAQPTFVLVTEETSAARVNYKYVDGKFVENEPTT